MTGERPLISVIMPACNHEQFVGDALGSLIGQTYQNLELVVLDDGSTDGTFARIQALKPELDRRFGRVEIATQDNQGSARTIMRCLQLVRSDLVFMLDSDDVAHPQAIDCLWPQLDSSEVALAVGDNQYIDADAQAAWRERDGDRFATLLAYYTAGRNDFSLDRDFGSYQSLIQGNYVPNGWLFRRSAVDAVGGYAVDVALDDWSLLLRLAKRYHMRFVEHVLLNYRLHERNTSTSRERRHVLETARILLQERAYCRAHGFEREWLRHAHRVFETLTPDAVQEIVDRSTSDDNGMEELTSRIEDLVRIGKLETQVLRLQWDLRHQRTSGEELSRLTSQLDDARRQVDSLEADHTRLRVRLDEAVEQGRRSNQDLAAAVNRLASLESSRSWRWTAPIRMIAAALSPGRVQPWKAGLDVPTLDPANLGALELTGWAFHERSPVLRVEISVQGGPPVAVEYGIERPDVATAFPNCNVGRPGFRTSIHLVEESVRLRIRIVCADGQSHESRHTLKWPPAIDARIREIYGAPDRTRRSPLDLARCLLTYGRIGADIWESQRIRGWIRGDGEAEALARASDSLQGSPVIVEVGSFLGCSTVLLAGPRKRRRAGHVHCVDSFSADGDDAAVPVYRAIAASLGMSMRQAFEHNLRRAGLLDWVTVHEMRSHEAAQRWQTPIDMLYLDGDVSLEGSREIFHDWSRFLRGGGILAINGTADHASRMASYRVVEEFVHPPGFEDIRQVDHITFARKSPGADR